MAKRLNWEKLNQIKKVIKQGAASVYDELPPAGSYADKSHYWTRGRHKIRPKFQTKPTTTAKGTPNKAGSNSKVLRRRKGEETVELHRKAKS